jgi:ribosomal protein L24
MSVRHPYQDQRVIITQGQYEGRTAKVLRVLPDHGEYGFAEVEIEEPSRKKPVVDLVPVPYLHYAGGGYADHA